MKATKSGLNITFVNCASPIESFVLFFVSSYRGIATHARKDEYD